MNMNKNTMRMRKGIMRMRFGIIIINIEMKMELTENEYGIRNKNMNENSIRINEHE